MEIVTEIKRKIQNIYANYSTYIDKVMRFLLAFVSFFVIGREIGYMHVLANPVVALGLALVCTFLPSVCILLVATVLILIHAYAVSLGVLIIMSVLFLIMYAFYIRFSPQKSIVILIMVVGSIIKVPASVMVVAGLLGTPVCAVPVGLGTAAYYMIYVMKKSAATIQATKSSNLANDMIDFAKHILSNKEMWLMIIVGAICIELVYTIRCQAMKNAWKFASVVGAAVFFTGVFAGNVTLGLKEQMGNALIGAVVAVISGLVSEMFFFEVDYKKCEILHYEDDEYCYYVKAVPKMGNVIQQKRAKEDVVGTEVIDAKELRKKTQKHAQSEAAKYVEPEVQKHFKKQQMEYGQQEKSRKQDERRKSPVRKKRLSESDTEHLLLTQSLERELNLKKDKEV